MTSVVAAVGSADCNADGPRLGLIDEDGDVDGCKLGMTIPEESSDGCKLG